MPRARLGLSYAIVAACASAHPAIAQEENSDQPGTPISSREQAMDQRNRVPESFETIIIATDEKSRERAMLLIELYDVFARNPSPDALSEYIAEGYIQHSSSAPDGYDGIGMVFSQSVKRYPVRLDVHKVMVVGDWAMAHVNFRNLEKRDAGDLGYTAVDMFTFNDEDKVTEHWDAVQGIPTYSVSPRHGMFRRVLDHPVWPYETVEPIVPPVRDIPWDKWWEAPTAEESAADRRVRALPQGSEPATYYDRHKIDLSNLRDFYDGLLIADVMIHADGMFDAKTKWRLTLRQMILAESGHHTARSAYQLSQMGVPVDEIQALFSSDYVDNLDDPRLKAAFTYVETMGQYPIMSSPDVHAQLRTNYTDRQIAELMQLASINNASATHDAVLPIAPDQETLNWATENLASVGWGAERNASTTSEEQRANPFVGNALKEAVGEIDSTWQRNELGAVEPTLTTDWVNFITG